MKILKLLVNGEKPWGEIQAPEKDFKTGSRGFHASGKIIDPDSGKSYQVSCSIVEIGSKPKGK